MMLVYAMLARLYCRTGFNCDDLIIANARFLSSQKLERDHVLCSTHTRVCTCNTQHEMPTTQLKPV